MAFFTVSETTSIKTSCIADTAYLLPFAANFLNRTAATRVFGVSRTISSISPQGAASGPRRVLRLCRQAISQLRFVLPVETDLSGVVPAPVILYTLLINRVL